MPKRPNLSKGAASLPVDQEGIQHLPLELLDLDPDNPRFGADRNLLTGQKDVLDWIVENFGIDDVIGSLAVSGYFEAEPVVAIESNGRYIVKEGNRRLAACLILAGDERAKNQVRRAEAVKDSITGAWTPQTKIPVLSFKSGDGLKLLSYLGVRHIVSAQPWDSYAKAAWIASVIDNHEMTLEQITEVTGDRHKTIGRLLEAYYTINQLEAEGKFSPDNSIRRGRGSNTKFPFSWVYTLFGYPAAREFLGLSQGSPKKSPIASDRLDNAALLTRSMFGDKSKGISPAINDSRQLGNLAGILRNPIQVEQLRRGEAVAEIELKSLSPVTRLSSGLLDASSVLEQLVALVGGEPLTMEDKGKVLPLAKKVRTLSRSLVEALEKGSEDE